MAKSRIFLFLLLFFIVGVALRSFVPVPVWAVWVIFSAGSVMATAALVRSGVNAGIYGWLFIALAVGIFRFAHLDLDRPNLISFYGREVMLRGYVVGDPERTSKVERLKLWVESVDEVKISQGFYVLVTLGRYPQYKIGDELLIRDVLDEPKNFAEFDYISYLAKNEVFATMFFPRKIEKTGEGRGSMLKLALSRIKYAFEENLDRSLPEPHAAFIKGLTLGERESLPEELVENFKRTGTTHIVALSGYNITIIGRFFIGALLLLTIPFRISFWIATSAIFLFVILTGASPSVVRAGIMGFLVLIAQREGRLYHMTNALAFAGAVMIFHNPKIFRFDAAFQLSFLATLGLVYLAPRVESFFDRAGSKLSLVRTKLSLEREEHDILLKSKTKPDKYKLFPLKQILIETLAAQIMVLPLLIYLFGRISLVSPITNLLVLVAVPSSMAFGFLTGFLGFIWDPLARIFGAANWVLLEYKISVIELFAKFPAAYLELNSWVIIPILIFYTWLLYYFFVPRKFAIRAKRRG